MKYFKILLLITLIFMLFGCGVYHKKDIDTVTREDLQKLAEGSGATKVRAFTSLTGGGTGALDAIDGASLYDGDVGIVVTSSGAYFYALDDDSGATESTPSVISPDTNAGNKRWILVSLYSDSLNAIASDDGAMDFTPSTSSETRYRVGPNHDSVGDDNDNFEIRRSSTPGTSVDFLVNRSSSAYRSDKVTQDYSEVGIDVFDWATNVTTGDGKFYIHIGQKLDGMNLSHCHAEVITAGTTGTTDIQVYNVTDSQDMLSTKLTIDSTETGSDTATPYVINTSYDDISENDLLRIDVDAVSTTAPKGLIVTLGFSLP